MSLFHVNNLSVGYGKHNVLSNLSFESNTSETIGILGANGSGKSTLLKAICGILPHTGTCQLDDILLENQTSKQIAKLVNYIPQRSGISIDISVLDTVLMGFYPHLSFLEHPSKEMKEMAMELIQLVGLKGKEDTNYLHLSEGQKQLCILARTLVTDSKLLLLDEPESALDFHFRHQMLKLICEWNTKQKSTTLLSLHDPLLALNYCDRLLLLSNGQIVSNIYPKTDSISSMEEKLCLIYGDISLVHCTNKHGQKQLIMLKGVANSL